MSESTKSVGVDRFDNVIVGDDGSRSLRRDGTRFDADDILRLTDSEVEALAEYDRVVTRGPAGTKVVIEMIPETARNAPIEVRDCDE